MIGKFHIWALIKTTLHLYIFKLLHVINLFRIEMLNFPPYIFRPIYQNESKKILKNKNINYKFYFFNNIKYRI